MAIKRFLCNITLKIRSLGKAQKIITAGRDKAREM